MSFPWSDYIASSASPSLLNSMKAKEPYERSKESKKERGKGAEEAARIGSRNYEREYLEVNIT